MNNMEADNKEHLSGTGRSQQVKMRWGAKKRAEVFH